MIDFTFHCPTELVFGKDAATKAGKLVKKYGGSRVLVITGGGSVKRNGIFDTVVKALEDEGLFWIELSGVQPNPVLSLVRKGMAIARENALDFILPVGGGSVIDTGKAIAGGLAAPDGKDVWDDYFALSGPVFEKSLGLGTVLTLAASGSEMSNSAVITNEETKQKRGINCTANYPLFSCLNPEYLYTLPPYQTACGTFDMLSHMMERYFTCTSDVEAVDAFLEAGMRTIVKFGPLCLKEPRNYNFRAQLMFCGTMAHNNILGLGREQDWACHKLEHEMSTQYSIAHGAGLAIITPAWMKYVYKSDPDRFGKFFTSVFGWERGAETQEEFILSSIEKFREFIRTLGLPSCLSEAGITDTSAFGEMAGRVLLGGRTSIGSIQKLFDNDFVQIYTLAK